MTLRRSLLLVAMFGLAIVAGLLISYYRPLECIGPIPYYSISIGMTAEDAEAVVGLPPGSYGPNDTSGGAFSKGSTGHVIASEGPYNPDDPRVTRLGWWGRRYAIRLELSNDGRVTSKRLVWID